MNKEYGIRIRLPESSTMNAPHLLGEAWESYRWFATRKERDEAYEDMRRQPRNYRRGDRIQQILEKVERES